MCGADTNVGDVLFKCLSPMVMAMPRPDEETAETNDHHRTKEDGECDSLHNVPFILRIVLAADMDRRLRFFADLTILRALGAVEVRGRQRPPSIVFQQRPSLFRDRG